MALWTPAFRWNNPDEEKRRPNRSGAGSHQEKGRSTGTDLACYCPISTESCPWDCNLIEQQWCQGGRGLAVTFQRVEILELMGSVPCQRDHLTWANYGIGRPWRQRRGEGEFWPLPYSPGPMSTNNILSEAKFQGSNPKRAGRQRNHGVMHTLSIYYWDGIFACGAGLHCERKSEWKAIWPGACLREKAFVDVPDGQSTSSESMLSVCMRQTKTALQWSFWRAAQADQSTKMFKLI